MYSVLRSTKPLLSFWCQNTWKRCSTFSTLPDRDILSHNLNTRHRSETTFCRDVNSEETRVSVYSSKHIRMADADDDQCVVSRSLKRASYDARRPKSFYSDSFISVFSHTSRFSLYLWSIIWLILHITRLCDWVKTYIINRQFVKVFLWTFMCEICHLSFQGREDDRRWGYVIVGRDDRRQSRSGDRWPCPRLPPGWWQQRWHSVVVNPQLPSPCQGSGQTGWGHVSDTFFFWLLPLRVATTDFPSPFGPIICILLRHLNHSLQCPLSPHP